MAKVDLSEQVCILSVVLGVELGSVMVVLQKTFEDRKILLKRICLCSGPKICAMNFT